MTTIDKLAWVHLADGKVLVARSRANDTFYLPGGKREPGESDPQALVREIREELTIELDPARLKLVGTFEAQAHGRAEGVLVRMTCYRGPHRGEIAPAAEIEELAWFSYRDRDIVTAAARLLFDRLHELGLLLE